MPPRKKRSNGSSGRSQSRKLVEVASSLPATSPLSSSSSTIAVDEWSDGELVSAHASSAEESDFEVLDETLEQEARNVSAQDTSLLDTTTGGSSSSDASASDSGWSTGAKVVLAAGVGVITTLASIQVGKVISNAVSAGANEAHQQFIRSDPLNPATFLPTTYISPFLRGALSMGVATAVKQCKGVDDGIDLQTTISRAEAWVQEAKQLSANNSGGLSMEQEKLAELWIEEARQLLTRYIETHSKELNQLLGVSRKIATTAISSSAEAPSSASTQRAVIVIPPPLPPGGTHTDDVSSSSTHSFVTVGAMLELAHRSVDAQNPTKDGLLLSKSDKRLLQLIEALEAMPRVVPITMQRYAPEEIDQRIAASEAMGSRVFIESMQGRFRTLAQNLWSAPSDQIKRVIVLASAPGVGKTQGMEQGVVQWIDWPFLKFKGSDLAGLKINSESNAYHVFCKMLAAKIATARDSRGQLTKCMVCYVDDMDRMLDDDGIFANDLESRRRLFLLFKDFGDALITTFQAQEPELFSYSLAEGMLMPFDMRHVHGAASFNKLPAEWLPDSGDQASRQRLACIAVQYADEIDRRHIATYHYVRRVLMSIRAAWSRNLTLFTSSASEGNKEEMLDHFIREHVDEEVLKSALLQVVQKDIEMFVGVFERQLGIRGLRELLDQVESKMMTLLPRDPTLMNSQAVFFGALVHLDALVQSIESYNGRKDKRMAEVELKKSLQIQLATEHSKLQGLPDETIAPILTLIQQCESHSNLKEQQVLLGTIRIRIAMWTNRVTLPEPDVAGRRLKDIFGYFAVTKTSVISVSSSESTTLGVTDAAAATKTTTSTSSISSTAATTTVTTTSDVDRFTPICTVFESVYWRMRAARCGKTLRNEPIVVNCADAGMPLVTTLIHGLAKVVGGVPVHTLNIHSAAQLVDNVDVYTVDNKDPRIDLIDPLRCALFVSHPTLGHRFAMTVRWVDVGSRKIPLITYSDYYVVIPNTMIDTLVKHTQDYALGQRDVMSLVGNDQVRVFHDESGLSNKSNAIKHVKSHVTQRVSMLDSVFSSAADPTSPSQRSLYESFVIVPIRSSTLALIDEWKDDTRNDLQGKDAFMRMLGEKLNGSDWKLPGNRSIDPRMLTVFLVDNSAVALSDTPGQRPALRWVMGNPPIQGRETQARQYLEAKLTEAHAAQDEMRQLLLQSSSSAIQLRTSTPMSESPLTMVLTEQQRQAFEHMVQFDMEQARKARGSWSSVLSPTPLMSSIDDLIARAQSACSPFGFQSAFPDIDQLRVMWFATYQTEMTQLENDWKRHRVIEQERIAREQAEEEQRKLEEQARNVAKQNIAYREAESDHWAAKYRNSNNKNNNKTSVVVQASSSDNKSKSKARDSDDDALVLSLLD